MALGAGTVRLRERDPVLAALALLGHVVSALDLAEGEQRSRCVGGVCV